MNKSRIKDVNGWNISFFSSKVCISYTLLPIFAVLTK